MAPHACRDRRSARTRASAAQVAESESYGGSVKVISVGALDLDRCDLAYAQRTTAGDMNHAIDLRRVACASAPGAGGRQLIDQNLDPLTHLPLETPDRNRPLALHEAVPALLFDLLGHRITESIGFGAFHRLVTEAAHAVELCAVEPVEEQGEVVFALAGESHDESGAEREVRADVAPAR